MPLAPGSSRAVISKNIDELTHHGSRERPHDQIVAIALHNADKYQHRAVGGGLSMPSPSFSDRGAARELQMGDTFHPGGLFTGGAGGRTDQLPRAVAADSFVIPADVISGIGQGDTMAGSKIMDGILSSGPFGTRLPRGRRADGGNASDGGISHVLVAGGEYLVNRDKVAELGRRVRLGGKSRARSDLAAGHEALRTMVDKVRKHQKKFLASAPKPKK